MNLKKVSVYNNFKLFDGNTGNVYHVNSYIPDGKHAFIVDQERIEDIKSILRWQDDGGAQGDLR